MHLSERKFHFPGIIFLLHASTMTVTIRAFKNVNLINSNLLSNYLIGFLIKVQNLNVAPACFLYCFYSMFQNQVERMA